MMRGKRRFGALAGNLHRQISRADFQSLFVHERHRAVETIKNLLPLAAIGDHVVAPQQAEMMTHGRLRQTQFLAKRSDVLLSLGKGQQNVQPGFIGKKFKE